MIDNAAEGARKAYRTYQTTFWLLPVFGALCGWFFVRDSTASILAFLLLCVDFYAWRVSHATWLSHLRNKNRWEREDE